MVSIPASIVPGTSVLSSASATVLQRLKVQRNYFKAMGRIMQQKAE